MIMKKLLLFLFTLLFLPMVANADSYGVNINGIYYNLFDEDKTAEVASNRLYSGDAIIPETVTYNDNQYSVTSIGYLSFYWCTGLTSVTIPNSVTNIGKCAFSGCTGLTSITIPNSVTNIGSGAFDGCTGLTSITIPNSVTSIGDNAFYECDGVTSITIPNSVTSIGDNAFYRCGVTKENFNNQSNITPSGLIVCDVRTESGFCIKDNALVKYLGKERTITIPNSVTSIGDEAFYRCSELTSITIPNSVTNIGELAFSECTGLTSITIPNSVTSIGDGAFSECTGLTSITIPNSVTSIGDGVFSGCSGLTSITIPNNVTNIGDYAFAHCSILTSVTIPNSVTNIGDYAFAHCSILTSVTIPNSVTNIGEQAFWNCPKLTSITIPNSVTSIGDKVFYECTGLTSITIPNSVTTIGYNAFDGCRGLTSITIPNSVTTIGDGAFYGCRGLTSITIPNSVTQIESGTFHDCSGLTSITIPNSVTSIGDGAFRDCKNLKTVYCYATKLPETNENTFGIHGLYINYATLYVPASAINEYKATAPWSWFGTILPIDAANTDTYSVKIDGIHYNLFEKDKTAEVTSSPNYYSGKVIIPEAVTYNDNQYSVTCIGNDAFYNYGLISVTIPNSVTTIGSNAFDDCKNLKTVYCYATKLPETSENTFGNYDDNQHFYINYATLYVPASVINKYKANAPWSWFGTILPIEDATTQIDATSSNNCNIITNGNDIIVKSDADGEKVSIYTFSGQLIGTTTIRNGSAVINTNLKPGSVAIVMIGQNTYKIRLD